MEAGKKTTRVLPPLAKDRDLAGPILPLLGIFPLQTAHLTDP